MTQHNTKGLGNHPLATSAMPNCLAPSILGTQCSNRGRGKSYWFASDMLVFLGSSDLYLICLRPQLSSDAYIAARMLAILKRVCREIVGPGFTNRSDLMRLFTPRLAYLYHGGHHNPAVCTITLSEALAMFAPDSIELRIRSINLDASSSSAQFPELNEFALL